MSEGRWRSMRRADLDAVHALAKRVHAAYPERPEVAEERLALAPEWCRVLEAGPEKGGVCGYLVAHPARLGEPPALDTLLGALPAQADTLYLHDIVIDPARRGEGQAARLVEQVAGEARGGFASLSLVSIAGLSRFWEGLGFEDRRSDDMGPILRSYDPQARYMVKFL
jgi:GNAT superfamily N-acetyltransferase